MPHVVVVGSINVDLVVVGERLPAAGETVAGGTFASYGGGKSANQAVAAARLGADVTFVGAVGQDAMGDEAVQALRDEGIDVSGMARVDAPTGVALIVVDAAGENQIAVASGANAALDADAVTRRLEEILGAPGEAAAGPTGDSSAAPTGGSPATPTGADSSAAAAGSPPAPAGSSAAPAGSPPAPAGASAAPAGSPPAPAGSSAAPAGSPPAPAGSPAAPAGSPPAPTGVLLLGHEVGEAVVIAAARAAEAAGWPVVLNPAPARELPSASLAVLTPNASEAEQLTGESDPEAAARALSASTGAAVLITLGARGALLLEPGGEPSLLPAAKVHVVDTTGAGDTVNGALAAELAAGRPLRDAAEYALKAAALSTTKPGARGGMPTREEVDAA